MKFLTPFILGLCIALLTSCGGGTQMAEGGIGGTGISMGKVTSFGSLYVNGVEFAVNNADFVYEQETAATIGDDSGIRVGMVVRITGSNDGVTGTADIVEYASLLKGTIDSKTIATNGTGSLVAMGQTVTVDADTVYDDSSLATPTPLSALPLSAVIEVSGFSDGTGNILATRIEVKTLSYSGETLNVKGLVSNLTSTTFALGTLGIDYSGATLPSSGISDGLYVEAIGILQGGTLIASEVQIEDDGDLVIAADGEEAELEGVVTGTLSPTLVSVNGQQVLVNDVTVFEPEGSDATSLVLGQPLEVSGVMDGITLVAAKIVLKPSAAQKEELEGVLAAIDTTTSTFTLLGQTVRVTSSTIFENDLSDEQTFNLSDLTGGVDYISVDLFVAADGKLEASKLEWERNPSQDPSHAEIEGYIQAADTNQATITLVNVIVDISDPTLSGFTPVIGDRIEITGVYDAATGILQASSVDNEED